MVKRIVLTLIFSQLVSVAIFAQLPPSGSNDTAVPLDPNLGILLVSSVAYSIIRLNRNERK
jgi:hypothetical protein